jgi:hypothetical protein
MNRPEGENPDLLTVCKDAYESYQRTGSIAHYRNRYNKKTVIDIAILVTYLAILLTSARLLSG